MNNALFCNQSTFYLIYYFILTINRAELEKHGYKVDQQQQESMKT
jgi:hypothetical protein